jgi:pyrroloquinoline quinone (PQQ) biosynthesis protein C
VEAIATASEDAARVAPKRPELRRHADEERAHIDLWDDFVSATDGDAGAAPTPETKECVRAWSAERSQVARLITLYAIESGQPEISRIKREGLVERYGFVDGPGTAYFRVHERRDAEHAAEARALVEDLASRADEDQLVATAESAFRANWRLLDGV